MGCWAWLLALEVGMADTARLVLFSSLYLFLPSFILILSPGRFQLKSINCWDVSFPPCRGCWVQFGCGFFLAQREEQQDGRAVLGVCLYILQRCPVGVAHSFLGSDTLPQQQGHCSVPPRLVTHQELCVSPQVLMDLAGTVWGFISISISLVSLSWRFVRGLIWC